MLLLVFHIWIISLSLYLCISLSFWLLALKIEFSFYKAVSNLQEFVSVWTVSDVLCFIENQELQLHFVCVFVRVCRCDYD